MSEKVVITKEQAEAINKLRFCGFPDVAILKLHFFGDESFTKAPDATKHFPTIRNMHVDTLSQALYVGFKVEKSPEEIVLHNYKESTKLVNESEYKFDSYHQGQVDAIEMVLRTLKIEIEGIHK